MGIPCRPYQQEAVDALWEALKKDDVWAVGCAMATGLGKTRVGLVFIDQHLDGGRALWLAHRNKLVEQPLERLRELWPDANIGVVRARKNDVDADIILGSVATLTRENRMQELLAAGKIDIIVTDECHHGPSESYERIYKWVREHNPNVVHVGLTATPWRRDGKWAKGEWTFQELPRGAQKNIRWGIREGWLVPPVGTEVETEVYKQGKFAADLSRVRVTAGDFNTGELADVLDAAQWHLLVAKYYLEHFVTPYDEEKEVVGSGEGKQAIAFTVDVASSKKLCEELKSRGVKAAHIDGTMSDKDRKPIERGFTSGKIQVLCNCAVYTEGADFPSAEVVLMARPTRSPGLFTQIVGRGLRPYPGKDHCDVVLFAGHGADLMTLFDLGKSKKVKKAEKAAKELGIPGVSAGINVFDEHTVTGAGTKATLVSLFNGSKHAWFRDGAVFSLGLGETKDEKSGNLYQRTLVILPPNGDDCWHLMALGRRVWYGQDQKRHGGQWRVYELDAGMDIEEMMDMAAGVIERRACNTLSKKRKRWRKDPASKGQLGTLHRMGVTPPKGLGKGDASRLISHYIAMNVLRKEGYVS